MGARASAPAVTLEQGRPAAPGAGVRGKRTPTYLTVLWAVYYVLFFFGSQYEGLKAPIIWGAGPLLVLVSVVGLVRTGQLRLVAPIGLFFAFLAWVTVFAPVAVNMDGFFYTLRRVAQNLLMFSCLVLVLRQSGRLSLMLWGLVGVGVLNGLAGLDDASFVLRAERVRTEGITENPNALGFLAMLGIVAAFGLWSRQTTLTPVRALLRRGVLIVAIAYQFVITLAAASRGAFLSLVAALFFWPVLRNRERILRSPARLVAVGVFSLLLYFGTNYVLENTYLGSRVQETRSTGLDADMRATLASEALSLFAESPVYGIGLGQFRYLSRYRMESHGDYTELLSNTGLVGTVMFVTLYLMAFWRLQRARRLTSDVALSYDIDVAQLLVAVLMFSGAYRPNFLLVDSVFILGVAHGISEFARAATGGQRTAGQG